MSPTTTSPSEAKPAAGQPAAPKITHAIPCLSYKDARQGIQWLVDAFGAEARHIFDGPDDTVAHAELWFGSACVMMGSLKENKWPPHVAGETAVYIVVENAEAVDRLHDRAVQHGGRIVITLRDTDYGSHDFAALDPEGNFWSFGTYAPV